MKCWRDTVVQIDRKVDSSWQLIHQPDSEPAHLILLPVFAVVVSNTQVCRDPREREASLGPQDLQDLKGLQGLQGFQVP